MQFASAKFQVLTINTREVFRLNRLQPLIKPSICLAKSSSKSPKIVLNANISFFSVAATFLMPTCLQLLLSAANKKNGPILGPFYLSQCENVNEQVLRESMCHSDKTAKIFYWRQDLTEVAAQAAAIIAKCTVDTPESSSPSTKRRGQTPNWGREGRDINGFRCGHRVGKRSFHWERAQDYWKKGQPETP